MQKAPFAILLASALLTMPIVGRAQQIPPDPSKSVARRVEHLKTLLDLTPGQAQSAATAFTNAATANAPLFAQLRAAHQTLQADIQGGSGSVQADSTTIANWEAQIRANDATAEKAFWSSLNSEQQTKYKSLRGRGGFGHGPGGPGDSSDGR